MTIQRLTFKYANYLIGVCTVLTCVNSFAFANSFETILNNSQSLTPTNCEQRINMLSSNIQTTQNKADLKMSQIQGEHVAVNINELWLNQLSIKKLSQNFELKWGHQTQFAEICQKLIFNLMQKNRVALHREIFLYNRIVGNIEQSLFPFKTKNSITLTNPLFQFNTLNDLESGDIVLTRSADQALSFYAQQGGHYQPLTHASMVYKSKNGSLYIIESRNSGLAVTALNPESEYFKRDYVNILILRSKNHRWSSKAAEILLQIATGFDTVSGLAETYKNNVPYRASIDFKIIDTFKDINDFKKIKLKQLDDRSFNIGLSCIEAIRTAFRFAADELQLNQKNVPQFIDKSFIDFLAYQRPADKIGVDALPINFLELDTRFDIVAEWRFPSELQTVVDRDVVVGQIYKWVLMEGYKFSLNYGFFSNQLIEHLFKRDTAYSLCIFLGYLCKDYRSDLYSIRYYPDNIIQILVNSFYGVGPLNKMIQRIQKDRIEQDYLPLNENQINNVVESERQKDLKRYLNCQPSGFHKYLRAPNPHSCELEK